METSLPVQKPDRKLLAGRAPCERPTSLHGVVHLPCSAGEGAETVREEGRLAGRQALVHSLSSVPGTSLCLARSGPHPVLVADTRMLD